MTNPGIRLTKIWHDDDMVELRIEVSDGESNFVNQVYVGNADFAGIPGKLEASQKAVYGGVLELQWGEFGPESAHGAFHARLYFGRKVHVTCRMESDYFDFGNKSVARQATLCVITEPALLDRFISQCGALVLGSSDEAFLECL